MKCKKRASAKVLFGFFNTVFFASGFIEVVCGFLLLCDSRRILLSRLLVAPDSGLTEAPFYYLALALLVAGLTICATAALGCWATYMPGYIILTLYFVVVLGLLVGECAGGAAAAAWPRCAGLAMARGGGGGGGAPAALRAHYAVPDYEPFTAAVDLAQTELECCGMTDARDYDTSAWRLRRLGPRGVSVPPSCCVQVAGAASYLNPAPLNQSRCQEITPNPTFRHVPGCVDKLEDWYQQQYLVFMFALFVVAIIKLGILLSTVFSCVRLRQRRRASQAFMMKTLDNRTNENMYESKMGLHDEPVMAKYTQPNNFYSPRIRNPRIFHNRPNEMV